MKALLIEDEENIAMLTENILKQVGYQVEIADNGADGLQLGLTDAYEVILLDVNLPEMNGFEVLDHLRRAKIQTPIMMLTAYSQTQDKVKGLSSGADDYLTKPFDREELVARVEAITRRGGTIHVENTFNLSTLEFNPKMLTLSSATEQVHLPLKEAQILELLIKKEGHPLSPEQLIDRVWDYDDFVSDDVLRQHISRLRKKIKQLDSAIEIKVVRKIGYLLRVK